jgi:hypothetical protein
MATNISYENEFENFITTQQVSKNYFKVYKIDGNVKKKEEFKNNELENIIYYLDTSETESEAISSILTTYNSSKEFEIRSVENIGNYQRVTCKMFDSSGVFENFEIIKIYDNNGRIIYEKEEDEFNGVTTIDIRKYMYENEKEVFEFIYNNAGDLKLLKGVGSPFVPENNHSILSSEITNYFPNLLIDNLYYSNGDELPS